MIPKGGKVNDVVVKTLWEQPSYFASLIAAAGMNAKAGPGAPCEDLRHHVDDRKAKAAPLALRQVMISDIGGSMVWLL